MLVGKMPIQLQTRIKYTLCGHMITILFFLFFFSQIHRDRSSFEG